jgi:hypothetical protein
MRSSPDYVRLSAEHAQLKKIYAAAVDRLFAVGYQVTDTEYRKLKDSIEEARVQMEIVRLKLEEYDVGVQFKAG